MLTEQGKTWSLFSMADGHEEVEAQVNELLRSSGSETRLTPSPRNCSTVTANCSTWRCVRSRPGLLLLDEPTSGVSTREKEYVIETIVEVGRAEGVTTVTIEHDMDIVTASRTASSPFIRGLSTGSARRRCSKPTTISGDSPGVGEDESEPLLSVRGLNAAVEGFQVTVVTS